MSENNTPHINPTGPIAKTVLMPGDPLRAKYIAETFLEDVVQFNDVRGMLGFTGQYKGRTISVMGSGMGQPSIGIYSYELFTKYDVDNIIRIGSAGSYDKDVHVYDVIMAESAWSESTFAKVAGNIQEDTLSASKELNDQIEEYAKELNIPIKKGKIHSSDVFYRINFDDYKKIHQEQGCICVEMESFALFANAQITGKNAACILTISDSLVTHEATSAKERQESFNEMMKLALEFAR